MKRLLLFLTCVLTLFGIGRAAEYEEVYTLTPASGSNNSYDGNCDVTIDGIQWNLTGNSTMNPWRIGGKSLTNKDRELYSKTPITENIGKVEMNLGAMSGITLNKFTFIVSKNSDFSNPVYTGNPTASANSTITITKPSNQDWSKCYYKFVFTVSVTGTSNKYMEFTNAKFYKELSASDVQVTLKFPQESYEATLNEEFVSPKVQIIGTTEVKDNDILYSIQSDNDAASITSDGIVTLNTVGTATVTARVNKQGYTGSTSYTLTIDKPASGEPSENSYQITFKKGNGDGTEIAVSTGFDKIFETGSEYVSTIPLPNKVYYASSAGLKFGTSSAAGNITFNLSDQANKKIESVVLSVKNYGTDSNIGIKVNGVTQSSINNSYLDDVIFALNPETETSEITIEQTKASKGRFHVEGITINYIPSDPNLKEAGLYFEKESVSKSTADSNFTITVNNPNNISGVQYSSSNEDVASVDATTGYVTIEGAGTTTITATTPENKTYKAGKASYTLTVTQAHGEVIPTPGDGDGYFTIEFDDVTTDETSDISANDLLNYITQGKDYVASASGISKVYKGVTGLKFGSSKGSGSVTLKLSELGQVEAKKIAVEARGYNATNSILSVNGKSKSITSTTADEYEYVLDGTKLEEIKLETSGSDYRVYVKAITIYFDPPVKLGAISGTYGDDNTVIEDTDIIEVDKGTVFTFTAENATDIKVTVDEENVNGKFDAATSTYTWTIDEYYDEAAVEVTPYLGNTTGTALSFFLSTNVPKPGVPVVMIGEETLENGDSKVVAEGTVLTITCDNSTSIIGLFEDDDIELIEEPFTYTITKSGELLIYGKNSKGVDGEGFSYTFTVGEVDTNMPAVGSNFKQILNKNAEAELEADKYYVIGRHYESESKPVAAAMSVNFENGNFKTTTEVTFENYVQKYYDANATEIKSDKNFDILTTNSNDVLILKLEKNGENWALKTVNYGDGFVSSQKYISAISEDGTALQLTDSPVVAFISFTTSNNVKISFADNSSRWLYYNDNGSINYQKPTSANLQLFKYTTAKKFEYPVEEIRVKAGDSYPITLEGDYPQNITYRKKQNVACFEVEGNVITANKIQSADGGFVMAEWEESADWFGNLVEIPVVVRYPAEISFRHGTDPEYPVRGKIGVGVTAQAVYYNGDGEVTYSSSHPAELKVDKYTGMIRPEDMVAAKTEKLYTITAHVEGESNSYVEDDAVYYILLEAPEVGEIVPAGEKTFDFTKKGYGMFDEFTSFNTSNGSTYGTYYEDNVNETAGNESHVAVSTMTENPVTLYVSGKYRWMNKNELRVYGSQDSYMTFSVPTGYSINSITFTGDGSLTSRNLTSDIDGQWNASTWTADENINPTDVKIIFSLSQSNFKIESITLNLSAPKEGSSLVSGLAFDIKDPETGEEYASNRILNIFAEEEKKLPYLKHNDALTFDKLRLDIDEVDEKDEDESFKNYEINGKDFDDIKIKVNVPGVYTFRAEYKGEEFLNSMAILRLNVFPKLIVDTSDDTQGSMSLDERNDHPGLTLVDADVLNDGETMAVEINLPTIENLDPFKYSTVTMSNISIKHGDEEETSYTYDEYKDLGTSMIFNQDGYVRYTMTYANTEDFSKEVTVHVIMMPKVPNYEFDNEETPKTITLTAANNDAHATLQYYTRLVDPNEEADKEAGKENGDINKQNVKRRADVNFDIPEDGWNDFDDNKTQVIDVDNTGGDTFELYFRSVKNLSEIMGKDASELNDTQLVGPYIGYIAVADDGNTNTGIEEIGAEEGEAVFFNTQGIQVKNPERGQIYIVVKDGKAAKVVIQ